MLSLGEPVDQRDLEQISQALKSTEAQFGGVDVLVANAGIAGSNGPVVDYDPSEWKDVIDVNLTGVFNLNHIILPGMIDRGYGRVVNIASIAGKVGHPYIAAYAASKHAVIGFTRAVAMEAAPHGVTVNAVCPGYVDTPLTDGSVERIVAKTGISAEQALEYMKKMSPQGRLIDAEEVAYLTLCLCDPRARGVNGQGLVIDGGTVQS